LITGQTGWGRNTEQVFKSNVNNEFWEYENHTEKITNHVCSGYVAFNKLTQSATSSAITHWVL